MTEVHVDLRRPQRGTTDRQPVAGTLDVSLYRRQKEGTHFTLVTAFAQVLVDGQCLLELTPTDGTNAWVIQERVRDGKTRTVGVPDSATTVEYVDLPDLTGTDLTPATGTASATATQFRGAWQSGTAYPAYTFVTNNGTLYFTDQPVPARQTFTPADWKAGPAGVAADATTSSKGAVQLAGDLAGTAAAPTVPALAGKLGAANNLADVALAATARTNLGLGTAATHPVGDFDPSGAAAAAQAAAVQRANHTGTQPAATITGLAAVATSGTKADVGLGNVDNTPDNGKPVSTAQQAALDLKAPLASPTFTGAPKAPTAAAGDSSTLLATTAFVQAAASSAGSGAAGSSLQRSNNLSDVASPSIARTNLGLGTAATQAATAFDAAGAAAAVTLDTLGAAARLTTTAVKTGNYAAAAQDLVPVDTTTGPVTVTLPAAPADRTRVAVKLVLSAATVNPLTLATGSGDVFNRVTGPTTISLPLLNQAVTVQYAAGPKTWLVVADDVPLTQLDARYDAAGAATAATSTAAQRAANLSDLANASTARGNLGLGTAATQATTAFEPAGLSTATAASLAATYQTKIVVNVRDFGAVGDGSTDDTAAIRRAAATLTHGALLWFPVGTYYVSGTINITVSASIEGAVAGDTQNGVDAGTTILNKYGNCSPFACAANSVAFRRLSFVSYQSYAVVTSNQCAAITVSTGNRCIVEQCHFAGWWKWVWLKNCANFTIRDNAFSLCGAYGLHLQNVATPDNGDSVLTGNSFIANAPWTCDALVRWESGGGLRVSDNKFLGISSAPSANYLLDFAIADGATTIIALIEGNSFEQPVISNLRFTHAGPLNTGNFSHVTVNGNQFTCTGNSGVGIELRGLASSPANLAHFHLADNEMRGANGYPTGGFISATNVDSVSVAANHFSNGPVGITVDPSATNVSIDSSNTFFGVPVRLSGVNSATSLDGSPIASLNDVLVYAIALGGD